MGVIVGAVGKSPAIEKVNYFLQMKDRASLENEQIAAIVGSEEERKRIYPKVPISFAFLERDTSRELRR